jgi:superfamily II DNA or RNA helicase
VYYSGILSNQILLRNRRIKYINLPCINIENNNINFIPRKYQIDAFNVLKDTERGILDMPCGTGKTLITYLLSIKYDNIILISPLISTTNQLLLHYKKYYSGYENKTDLKFHLIHSQSNRNIDSIQLVNKNIIGSTFESCDVINKLIDRMTGSIYIVIDECHNLSNTMITDSTNEVYKLLYKKNKILFVSATPKYYGEEFQNIFGNTKYKLTWDIAIEKKYICEYNFYYPNTAKIIEYIDEIKFDKSIIEKTKLIYKAFFLLESIKNLEINKCIVYLKTIEEAVQFHKILGLVNIFHSLKLGIYTINKNTSGNTRNNYLTKFRTDKVKISIILNVHILDEGIDIPECDSVFITNPNNNPISIIQRISRANRLCSGLNKIAKILVWTKDKLHLKNIFKQIGNYVKVNIGLINNKFIGESQNESVSKININNIEIVHDNSNFQENKSIKILNNEKEVKILCPICGKDFVFPYLLEKHRNNKNPCIIKSKNYQCNYCKKYISNKYNLERHIKNCKFIPNNSRSSNIQDNLAINNLNKTDTNLCNICGKNFDFPYLLDRHKSSKRKCFKKTRDYKCHYCSIYFVNKYTLEKHFGKCKLNTNNSKKNKIKKILTNFVFALDQSKNNNFKDINEAFQEIIKERNIINK